MEAFISKKGIHAGAIALLVGLVNLVPLGSVAAYRAYEQSAASSAVHEMHAAIVGEQDDCAAAVLRLH